MDKRKKSAEGVGAPAWMATFADMMSLLLTFFVLLLSFAEMDIVKFKDALGSINTALGNPSIVGIFKNSPTPIQFENHAIRKSTPPNNTSSPEQDKVNKTISDKLRKSISRLSLSKDIKVENTKRGVLMRVRGKTFFNPGTAELKLDSHPVFQEIAQLMREFTGKKIAIEGHTDNIPISGGKHANNWELSTARAYAALKFLQEYEGIKVDRIHIAGFGDTHPIAPNDTPEGRSKNRRVEFVFYE